MSLTNAPDPAVRQAVVRQDLDNVLHPIVQHKVLEAKQMVVTGGAGLHDLRCRRHRLSRRDGRAVVRQHRLRPRRACRGSCRADAAAVLFPAHRDERAGRCAGREDQRTDGRRLSHLLRQLGFRGERGRLQDRPPVHEARISRAVPLQDDQPLLRLSRHNARHAWTPAAWASARQSSSRTRAISCTSRSPIATAARSA